MKKSVNTFQLFSLSFLSFFLFCTLLAILGIFYKWLILLSIFIALAGAIYWLIKNKKILKGWIKSPIFILILVLSLFYTVFYHDFSLGRDETGYQSAAVKLTQTSKLYFNDMFTRPFHPFREVEGAPQDTYTSQFLPGYNTYLAIWYLLFGIKGMLISNLPLIFITLFAIYQITKILLTQLEEAKNSAHLSKWRKFTPLLFLATFYTSFWFFRRTNSENLFMACFWVGAWFFLDAILRKKILPLLAGLIPFSFLILIRGEGWLYLIAYLILSFTTLVFLKIKNRSKSLYYLPFLFPIIVVIFDQIYSNKLGGSYLGDHLHDLQRTIINNFFKNSKISLLILALVVFGNLLNLIIFFIVKKKISLARISAALGICTALTTQWILHYYFLNSEQTFHWAAIRTSYVFNVFSGYLLILFFILLALGMLSQKEKNPSKIQNTSLKSLFNPVNAVKKLISIFQNPKKSLLLFLFLLVLPSFVFLFDPFVALDQPWFMRRFFAVFLPFIFILSGIFIYKLPLAKKYIYSIIGILLVSNLILAAPIIFFKEHQGAQAQLENIVKEIRSPNTLYLMSPGWRWQQWAYHLHYFYGLDILPNLDRFSEKDLQELMQKYKKVLIINTDKKNIFPSPFVQQPEATEDNPFPEPILYFPDQNLKLVQEFELSYPELEMTCPLTSYILNDDTEKYDYNRFNEKCFKHVIPSQINQEKTKLYIFELIQ